VNEVRRQAVLEIQRAVAAAESQASELVAAERANLERRLAGGAAGLTVATGNTGGHSPTGSQPSTVSLCLLQVTHNIPKYLE